MRDCHAMYVRNSLRFMLTLSL